MDSAAIDDPTLQTLSAARNALLDEALAEVGARRRTAGPVSDKASCAVCINGRADCDGLSCDQLGRHEVSPVVMRRFERCEAILAARLAIDPIDPLACNPKLSLESLHWRCERALRCAGKLPPETLGAWLGFVQGCLAMRGLIGPDDLT